MKRRKHHRPKLTERQKRFVDAYIISGNGSKAAIDAGYKKETARQQGSQLLTKPHIKSAVADKQGKIRESTVATQQQLMEFWTRVTTGKVAGRVNMSDRLRASELLGKACAMFTDRLLHTQQGPELTEIEAQEAQQLATIRIDEWLRAPKGEVKHG